MEENTETAVGLGFQCKFSQKHDVLLRDPSGRAFAALRLARWSLNGLPFTVFFCRLPFYSGAPHGIA